MPKRIDLVVQLLPPAPDAIGEYTGCLAAELANISRPCIFTGEGQPTAIPGVEIESCFSLSGHQRFSGLEKRLTNSDADVVILQYNPFAWGNRGWARDLIQCFARLKRKKADLTLAVMFHETYMMNPGWRAALMRLYQVRQFYQLMKLADICYFSTQLWAKQHAHRSRTGAVIHLPVGANIPLSSADPVITRLKLGLRPDDFVCGVFGGRHPSRMFQWIESAFVKIQHTIGQRQRVVLLHVGGEYIDWSVDAGQVCRTGRVSAVDAADAIATMDVLLNPLTDGISTRRGSAMAGIQQGVPLLSTDGHATDDIWRTRPDCIFLAAANSATAWHSAIDEALAAINQNALAVRESACQFYHDNFDWPKIANRILESLPQIRART